MALKSYQKPRGRYAEMELAAALWAKKEGLCLVLEGEGDRRTWTFYCAASGRQLLTYYPASLTWIAGPARGKARTWREAVLRAAERREKFLT
jgi:hypothetical protein